jgi:hypothetical protein
MSKEHLDEEFIKDWNETWKHFKSVYLIPNSTYYSIKWLLATTANH